MKIGRREFLSIGALGLWGLLAPKMGRSLVEGADHLGLVKKHGLGQTNTNGLVNFYDEHLQDGWYIQLSWNEDRNKAEEFKKELIESGYETTHQQILIEGTRTLLGKYGSLEEAVEATEKLTGFDEVGIVQSISCNTTWKYTVPISKKLEISGLDKETLDNIIATNSPKWPGMPRWLFDITEEEAKRENIDPDLVRAVATVENRTYDNTKIGPQVYSAKLRNGRMKLIKEVNNDGTDVAGGYGLMQITPIAAKDVGIDWGNVIWQNPKTNVQIGVKYLAKMLRTFDGNVKFAVAAYNAGPTAVLKAQGIPANAETQRYVPQVMTLYNAAKNRVNVN